MYMIWMVLDDPEKLDDLLPAWEEAGVGGVTVIESSGMHRRLRRVPMRYLYGSDRTESGNLTLLALVPDEATVQACLEATERITGNLDEPNTGVFAAWPLAVVKGVPLPGRVEPGKTGG